MGEFYSYERRGSRRIGFDKGHISVDRIVVREAITLSAAGENMKLSTAVARHLRFFLSRYGVFRLWAS